MSAIAPVYLNAESASVVFIRSDDAADHQGVAFNPDGISPTGVARYVDRSGGVPAAYPSLTVSLRRPSQGNRNYKAAMTVSIPTLETLGTSSQSGYLPGDRVGYSCTARGEFVIPERATLAERKALFAAFASLFCTTLYASDDDPSVSSGSPIKTMVETLETIY